jgi:hypothetical protein
VSAKSFSCRFDENTLAILHSRSSRENTTIAEQVRYLVDWGIKAGVVRPIPEEKPKSPKPTMQKPLIIEALLAGEWPKDVSARLGVSHDYVREIRSDLIKTGRLQIIPQGARAAKRWRAN